MEFLFRRFGNNGQSPTTTDLNIRYLYLEIAFASVFGGIIAFNSAFAIRLGATPFLNAVLFSAPALISAIGSVPAGRYLATRINRRLWLFGSLIMLRAGYLVVAALPLLVPTQFNPALWLVIWIVALNLPTAFFTNGWHVLLGDLIPDHRRAFVISRRQITWSVGVVIVSILAGQWLDSLPFPENYQLLYLFGFIVVLGSHYYLNKLVFPAKQTTSEQGAVVQLESVKLRTPIRRMLINLLVYQFGLTLPASLFNVYYIGTLKTSDGWLGLNSAAASAGVVAGYLVWEWFLRRHSYGWVQRRATLMTWLFPATLIAFTNLNVIMFANFLVNIMHGGVELSNFNVMLEISEPEERAVYVSWYNATIQLSTFGGPLLGAWMSDHVGIMWVFLLSVVFRIVGGLMFGLNRVEREAMPSTATV